MSRFFPRETLTWKLEEPPVFRRLTLSLGAMAALTGVVLRVYRSLALTHGEVASWLYVGGTFAVGAIFFFGMATLHLGNYTVRHWVWRAPVFGAVEVAAEMLTSLVLIGLHREPVGSGRAELHDWIGMALDALVLRVLAVSLFALLLAGVVQLVRFLLLRHEHRDSTAAAIHEDHLRQTAEHERASS